MAKIDFISNDLKNKIVEAVANNECSTVEDLMEQFNLTQYQATTLLGDNQFIVSVTNYSKAKAKLFFHTRGMRRLMNIAEGEDDKVAINAIKMLGEYSNDLKVKGGDVNVNVSLEQAIRMEEAKESKPFVDGTVIDVRDYKLKEMQPKLLHSPDDFDIDEVISNDLNKEFIH